MRWFVGSVILELVMWARERERERERGLVEEWIGWWELVLGFKDIGDFSRLMEGGSLAYRG